MCFAATASCSVLAPSVLAAQQLPGAIEPGRDRPIPQPPVQPDYNFTIEAPHRSAVPRAVDEVHFKLTDIQIVGAVTVITVENLVSAYTERWQTVLGLAFILIMIFAPEGIVGTARRLLARRRS